MSNNTHTSFSDVGVLGTRAGKNTYGFKIHTDGIGIVLGNQKLGSLIGFKEIETKTICYEDSIVSDDHAGQVVIKWNGVPKVRVENPRKQYYYCQQYDKSNKNKCLCNKDFIGKKLCNHIIKRCNCVIRKTVSKSGIHGKGIIGSIPYPTKQPTTSLREQVKAIQGDKGLRWREA